MAMPIVLMVAFTSLACIFARTVRRVPPTADHRSLRDMRSGQPECQ